MFSKEARIKEYHHDVWNNYVFKAIDVASFCKLITKISVTISNLMPIGAAFLGWSQAVLGICDRFVSVIVQFPTRFCPSTLSIPSTIYTCKEIHCMMMKQEFATKWKKTPSLRQNEINYAFPAPFFPTMHPWGIWESGWFEVVLSSLGWLSHSITIPLCFPVQGRIIPTGLWSSPFPSMLEVRGVLCWGQ